MAHVALPFPPDDPIYGGKAPSEARVIHLGKLALRGERGVLQIPAADMLRLRWNPFFPYVEARVLAFTGLGGRLPGFPGTLLPRRTEATGEPLLRRSAPGETLPNDCQRGFIEAELSSTGRHTKALRSPTLWQGGAASACM